MSKIKLLRDFWLATQELTFNQSRPTYSVYEVLWNHTKFDKFCSWKQQSRLKC